MGGQKIRVYVDGSATPATCECGNDIFHTTNLNYNRLTGRLEVTAQCDDIGCECRLDAAGKEIKVKLIDTDDEY